MSKNAYRSIVVSSIDDVSFEEWNQIISDTISVSHEVLKFSETNSLHSDKARYFLLRDDNECLQAISIALFIHKDSKFGVEGSIFGRLLERLFVFKNSLRPALICGLVGHGAPVFVRPGEDQKLWVRRMLDVMENYALDHKSSIGFSRLLSVQQTLSNELKRRKYCHAYGLPEAKININWHDEASYLKNLQSINKSYYKSAKKEINRFRKSGITIQGWDGENAQDVAELIEEHFNERNSIKTTITPESLSELKFKLKDSCIVYLAIKEEKIIGVAILLKKGDSARAWKVGVDHKADNNNFTYFNLAYYNLLADAVNSNLNLVWYGAGVLDAKLRRGCMVELTDFYYKPRRVLLVPVYSILFAIQRAWYGYKFSKLVENSNI